MHVHVDGGAVKADAQHAGGKFADHHSALAGFLQRPLHGVAADISPVDKKYLHGAVGSRIDRLGNKAFHADVVVTVFDGNKPRSEFPAVDRVNGGTQLSVAGSEQHLLAFPDKAEGNFRVRQRNPVDHRGDGVAFGLVGFEEFPSRGCIEEHLTNHDGRTHRAADFLIDRFVAAFDDVMHTDVALGGAGDEFHLGHRADGSKRLAAEAECRNAVEIGSHAYLAGGVTEESGRHIVRGNSLAVVGHADIRGTAVLNLNRNDGRARVYAVFHKLLDHGGRAFYHFPGGNQLGGVFI